MGQSFCSRNRSHEWGCGPYRRGHFPHLTKHRILNWISCISFFPNFFLRSKLGGDSLLSQLCFSFVKPYFGSSPHIKIRQLLRKLFPRHFYEIWEEGKLRGLIKWSRYFILKRFQEDLGRANYESPSTGW